MLAEKDDTPHLKLVGTIERGETGHDKIPDLDIIHVVGVDPERRLGLDTIVGDLVPSRKREFVFQCNIPGLLLGDLVSEEIHNQALHLLGGLAACGDGKGRSPARMFVSYDLGALVVKKAFAIAASRESSWPGIFYSTAQFIFRDCFQRARHVQELDTKIWNFLQARRSNAPWASLVAPGSIRPLSEASIRVTEAFLRCRATLRAGTVSIYAKRASEKSDSIFDFFTATLGISTELTVQEDIDTPSNSISGLDMMVCYRKANWASNSQWTALQKMLLPLAPLQYQHAIDSPEAESSVLASEEYKQWTTMPRSTILYIQGRNEAHSKSLADSLLLFQQSRRRKEQKYKVPMLSFCFSSHDPARSSMESMIYSSVIQVRSVHGPELPLPEIEILLDLHQLQRGWTLKDYHNILSVIIMDCLEEGGVLLLHDVDECEPASRKYLLDLLHPLAERSDSYPRVIVTSRERLSLLTDSDKSNMWYVCDQSGDTSEKVLISQQTHDNLISSICPGGYGQSQVRTALQGLDTMDEGQLEQIVRLIQHHASWPDVPSAAARSAFRTLLEQVRSFMSPAAFLDRILRSIADQQSLHWVLPWLLFGHRPISCSELGYLFCHRNRSQETQFRPSPDQAEVQQALQLLRSWLSSLIHIGDQQVCVRGFIWDILLDDGPGFIWNEIKPKAHETMLEFLSAYLTAPEVRNRLTNMYDQYILTHNVDEKHLTPSVQPDGEDFIFYAITAFPYHLEKSPQSIHWLKHIFCSPENLLTPWARMYWAMSNPFVRPPVKTADSAFSTLLSKRDLNTTLHDTIKSVIAASGTPVGLPKRIPGSCDEMDALILAVSVGNEDAALQHAQTILNKTSQERDQTNRDEGTGAGPTQGDIPWPSRVLWRATWLNMDRLVALLLANQMPTDPKDVVSERYPSPLYLASVLGHSQVVRAFLRAGANPRFLIGGNTSAVYIAAANGHSETVSVLLAENPGLVEVEEPSTPLYAASMYGHWETVITILSLGALVDNNPHQDGWTPLMIAVNAGHTRTVQALLENGANPNLLAPDKRDTSLWFACMRGQKVECLRALLRHGADPNHEFLQPPLVVEICAATGINSEMKIVLLDTLVNNTPPIDVNKTSDNGTTGLMWAATKGDSALVEWLLAHHANVNATYDGTYSALYFAVVNGHREIIQKLVANGAPANAVAPGDSTLLHLSLTQSVEQMGILLDAKADPELENDAGLSVLNSAVVQEKPDVVKLLIEHKVNIHHRDRSGWSPIHDASGHRPNAEIVRLLAEAGANLIETLANGQAPLHLAAASPVPDIVAALLEFRVSLDIDQPDGAGDTPLITAASHGNLECIRRLVHAGADINFIGFKGVTPLIRVIQLGAADEVVDFLISWPYLNIWRYSTRQGSTLNAACKYLRLATIEKLLERGADINYKPPGHGMTPLMSACRPSLVYKSTRDRHVSNLDQVVRTLVERGADIHATPSISIPTILGSAAMNASPSTINYLVSQGLSLAETDRLGRRPIHYAAVNGHESFEAVLLGDNDLLSTDITGKTVLHWASQFGRAQTVETILAHPRFQRERKKLLEQADMDGWTALCWALRSQRESTADKYAEPYNPKATVRVLLQHGASVSRPCRMGREDEIFTPLELAELHGMSDDIVGLVREADWAHHSENQPKRSIQAYSLAFYRCDICMNSIWGPVWQCETCPEFDICKKCHGQLAFYREHLKHEDGEPHTFRVHVEAPPEIRESSESGAQPADGDQETGGETKQETAVVVDPAMEAIMDFSVDDFVNESGESTGS